MLRQRLSEYIAPSSFRPSVTSHFISTLQVPAAADAGGQLPGAGLDHLGGAEGRARPHPHRERGADLFRREGHRLEALPQSQVSRGVGAGQLVSDCRSKGLG